MKRNDDLVKNKVYFSGLNELRALGALAVILHHIEGYKLRSGFPSLYTNKHFNVFISQLGGNGVFLFFVLSGFLITFLLLEEKETSQKISVKKFYFRRILRIWPLYFLLLIIGFFCLPWLYKQFPDFFAGQSYYNSLIEKQNYGHNLLLCIFFSSNIALQLFSPVAGFSQSWSVSIEEQFYFFWPWMVKLFRKTLPGLLIFIIVITNFFQWLLSNSSYYEFHPIFLAIAKTLYIDYMALGGLLVFAHKNQKWKPIFSSKKLFYLFLLALLIQLYFKNCNLIFSFTLGMIILFFIELKITNNALNFLGKISYGLYMFHPMMMYITFALASFLKIQHFIVFNLFVYIIILLLTILISYLSYQYFELYFLKYKERFSTVKNINK